MRRSFLVGGLIVVGITVVWFLLLFQPRVNKISDLQQELEAEIGSQQTLEGQIRELKALSDQQFAYQNGLAQLELSIPPSPDEAALIESIFALSEENRVELTAITPSVPAPLGAEDEYYEIGLSMSASGRYFDVLGFLFALEDSERLLRIDQIALSATTDETGTTILSVTMDARAFSTSPLVGAQAGGEADDGSTDQ